MLLRGLKTKNKVFLKAIVIVFFINQFLIQSFTYSILSFLHYSIHAFPHSHIVLFLHSSIIAFMHFFIPALPALPANVPIARLNIFKKRYQQFLHLPDSCGFKTIFCFGAFDMALNQTGIF